MQFSFDKGSFERSSSQIPRPLIYSPKHFLKRCQRYLCQRQWQTCTWMCMDQILPHCRSWLQWVISAENSPFAQRMRSLPLVLRYFAFFHESSAAYYQIGFLNVLRVSKTILTAGSVTPPSGTQVAWAVRRIFPFVNCSLFSACDLQQGWHQ